jgi:DNA integrity scanning protein DisA with diadenylate cyclase activity
MFLSKISTQMNQKKEPNMSININSSGTQSRVNIGSVDKSTNLITGDLKTDLENLKNLIESDYSKEDKPEIVQAVDQIKRTCTDPSKKNTLNEKLGWILTRTSEVSSISSLVIALLQTYTGT